MYLVLVDAMDRSKQTNSVSQKNFVDSFFQSSWNYLMRSSIILGQAATSNSCSKDNQWKIQKGTIK